MVYIDLTWSINEAATSQLQDVIRLKASARAFAALVDGCRLVTWGDPRAGGDSSMVASVME